MIKKLSLLIVVLAAVANAPLASHAKNSGLIFVSIEKSNNLIVLDPKTFQVVKVIEVSRRPRDKRFNSDHTQGCSTLFEVFHLTEGFDPTESCGVSILGDGVGLIEAEDIVGEAA